MPMEFPRMTGDAVKRRWEGREEGAPLDDPSCGLRSERQGQRKTIREALGILDRCFLWQERPLVVFLNFRLI